MTAFGHVCADSVSQDTKVFLRSMGFRSRMLDPPAVLTVGVGGVSVPPAVGGGGSLSSAVLSTLLAIVRARPLRVRVLEIAGNGNWTSRTQKPQI